MQFCDWDSTYSVFPLSVSHKHFIWVPPVPKVLDYICSMKPLTFYFHKILLKNRGVVSEARAGLITHACNINLGVSVAERLF